jgi:L-asparaginase II
MAYTNIMLDDTDHQKPVMNEAATMRSPHYLPIFELTRGKIVESVHYGAIAIVDPAGNLVASYGDVDAVTYLRSSSKPLQAIPFLMHGGRERFTLTLREIALICASHAGTDEHMAVLQSLQSKVGVLEFELLCGTHPIRDKATKQAMQARGEEPTPNRHNCSGKHTGMLAYGRMLGHDHAGADLPYTSPDHPVQKAILNSIAEMSGLTPAQIEIGIDGCSVPNFGMPLRNAALAFACLCDPSELPTGYAAACQTITSAMIAHPEMVAGRDSFDTRLMSAASGKIISKGGAEGYLTMGLMPGALGNGSPGLGIALKISDGDLTGRARFAVGLEVLSQLGGVTEDALTLLAEFGPVYPLQNWAKIDVGEARPSFVLKRYR